MNNNGADRVWLAHTLAKLLIKWKEEYTDRSFGEIAQGVLDAEPEWFGKRHPSEVGPTRELLARVAATDSLECLYADNV